LLNFTSEYLCINMPHLQQQTYAHVRLDLSDRIYEHVQH